MCTALAFGKKKFYFGRSLDYEFSYEESVCIVPRAFSLPFRKLPTLHSHHAMIGMAFVQGGYPLFYDAVNEKGLGMAGLNFPKNAKYYPAVENKNNVSPFEFIPYILGTCADLSEAKKALEGIHLAAIPFSERLPLSPLHWMISDKTGSIVVEAMEDGMHVYENPVGVLTNNPPFPSMMFYLSNFQALSALPPVNNLAPELPLEQYSRGMGAMGLPGDLSSASRFVHIAFVKHNSVCGESEKECVGQFFHVLGSVEQQNGCVKLGDKYEKTIYSSCCNADEGIYYYTTYGNRRIRAVKMHSVDLSGTELTDYPISDDEDILYLN